MIRLILFYISRRIWKLYRKAIENLLTFGDYKTVHILQGSIRGRVEFDIKKQRYYSFKGIPYAEPPIGKLRFKAPKPKLPWNGVRDAFEFGSVCRARDPMNPKKFVGTEDCLYLNVYTPETKNPQELKPVMIFIHGGSFILGSGNDDTYGPEYLVSEDVVLVTFNYRLGALGFLAFYDPEIECPGNTALKDIFEVLKWVKSNISQFNGDPNNVTLFGESAGAAMTHYMTLIPETKGYFHKAICQSGTAYADWSCYKSRPVELAKVLGFECDNIQEVYNFLIKVDVNDLVEAQEKLITDWDLRNGITCIWGPTIEVKCKRPINLITQHPITLLENGDFHDIPMIMGYNKDEGLLFLSELLPNPLYLVPDFEDNEVLTPRALHLPRHSQISKDTGDVLRRFYYGESIPSYQNIEPFIKVMTDIAFFMPTHLAVKASLKYATKPIFMYRFCVDEPQSMLKLGLIIKYSGVAHADELAYLFTNLLTAPVLDSSVGSRTVSMMTKMWTNFAKSGKPLDVWEPTDLKSMKLLNIGEKLEMMGNPDRERAEIWEMLSEKHRKYLVEYLQSCNQSINKKLEN